MDIYTALTLPGILTVVVIALSWIYVKNSTRLASDSLTTGDFKGKNRTKPTEKPPSENDYRNMDENSKNCDDSLRAELEPYLIKSCEIQDVPAVILLDDKSIESEMKEKGIANIQTYYKTSRLHIKEMEGKLTNQEKEQEREAQRRQLESIYKLMEPEKEKFGVDSIDQIEDQMKLYSQ